MAENQMVNAVRVATRHAGPLMEGQQVYLLRRAPSKTPFEGFKKSVLVLPSNRKLTGASHRPPFQVR